MTLFEGMTVPGLNVKWTPPSSFQSVMSTAVRFRLVMQTYSWAWLLEAGLASTPAMAMEASADCESGMPAFCVALVPRGRLVLVMQWVTYQCVRRGPTKLTRMLEHAGMMGSFGAHAPLPHLRLSSTASAAMRLVTDLM